MGGLDTVGTYVLGNITKAFLCVPKVISDEEARVASGHGTQLDYSKEKLAINKSRIIAAEKLLRESATSALSMKKMQAPPAAVDQTTERAQSSAMNTAGYNMIEVQYNPKSLNLRAVGGQNSSFNSGLANGTENQITRTNQEVSTTLNCELVFADVAIWDAFTLEGKTNINLENVGGAVAGLTSSHSVKMQVDGFISMLAQDYTRQVIFVWGTTIFRGELTRVNAQYKMFNRKGDPIMATVEIEIRQGTESELGYDETHWTKMFEKVFEKVEN